MPRSINARARSVPFPPEMDELTATQAASMSAGRSSASVWKGTPMLSAYVREADDPLLRMPARAYPGRRRTASA